MPSPYVIALQFLLAIAAGAQTCGNSQAKPDSTDPPIQTFSCATSNPQLGKSGLGLSTGDACVRRTRLG